MEFNKLEQRFKEEINIDYKLVNNLIIVKDIKDINKLINDYKLLPYNITSSNTSNGNGTEDSEDSLESFSIQSPALMDKLDFLVLIEHKKINYSNDNPIISKLLKFKVELKYIFYKYLLNSTFNNGENYYYYLDGFKFNCDWLRYKDLPNLCHSDLMISFVPPNKKLKAIDLVKRMRLANVVNKIFLLGTLQRIDDIDYKGKGWDLPYKPLFLSLKWSGIV
ncbi:hypothetical protein CONCODRAFT_18120 [Conidiobolus coronatus NRRL 28638]|uniref:tRNA-intron lyase n=1 Tax=Conidiobolus coronatus (strain ATCC 28846 / CBS 209.66 / NRRL 28638) TaxID=796925 RepID=A0A137P449_CONC2|nr:hypothetical protein CONCODRAFT_18120 [Conidiobolus coronatus NRRL 28638]|eukprot:KXN69719.1 hypothetical protein CONCODRAFT_18120 [Conidiobolus coronatus NRRL 28638]